MTEPLRDRDLRVSNDERAHVVDLLEKATGRGIIDLDEFSARSDTALAAKTRGQLNAVLIDLPGLVNVSAPAAAPIAGSMTKLRRDGHWTVPAELTVQNSAGKTILDFREARIDFPQVRVELDVSLGSVQLRLPEGATVNAEAVQFALGRFKGKRVQLVERPGNPHFVLTGRLSCGSLRVERPKVRR